jgi:hypothetical protein
LTILNEKAEQIKLADSRKGQVMVLIREMQPKDIEETSEVLCYVA